MRESRQDAPSLVELAVRRLRAEIVGGAFAPGERLVEEQLTRRLGISRAPLREALRLLGQQGLVEHLPRRGRCSTSPCCPNSRSASRSGARLIPSRRVSCSSTSRSPGAKAPPTISARSRRTASSTRLGAS